MSDLAVLASDPGVLDTAADPGANVVLACERAKAWLAHALEHGDIASIVETKAQADAIRVYSRSRELGRDAELAASEIVRRAERGIGLAVRKGQADGTIRNVGVNNISGAGVEETTGMDRAALSIGPYAMADDVPDEVFEEAIAEAKAEGQMTRANVVRKVKAKKPTAEPMDRLKEAARKDPAKGGARVKKAKEMAAAGYTSRQIGDTLGITAVGVFIRRHGIEVPADAGTRGTHRIDPNRVVGQTVIDLEGTVLALSHVNPADVTDPDRQLWIESMHRSLSAINRFKRDLIATQEESP